MVLMTFLNYEIQALQHHRKKCVYHKEDYIKDKPHDHIPWLNFDFLGNTRIIYNIYIYIYIRR